MVCALLTLFDQFDDVLPTSERMQMLRTSLIITMIRSLMNTSDCQRPS